MNNFRITLGGKVHHVTVDLLEVEPTGAPAATTTPKLPAAPRATGGSGEVRSPMSGKLVSFDVKAGQPVEQGTQVATIEAMKMNTYVFAPRAGTVTNLVATAGEAVAEHDLLVTIG